MQKGQPGREILIGAPVYSMGMHGLGDLCMDWIRRRRTNYVCVANVHVVTESVFNSRLRKALWGAALVVPDGMPLVWFLRARGHRGQERMYGPDVTQKLLRLAGKRRWRVGLFGGHPYVLECLRAVIGKRWPRVMVAGLWSPPFRREFSGRDLVRHARLVNGWKADILFVGLGAPKQEIWMQRIAKRLRVPVVVGVGAAFDFLAGTKPQAPRWMMRSGLEWLFRLFTEPRRLWRRYVVWNSLFVVLLVLQLCGVRWWRRTRE